MIYKKGAVNFGDFTFASKIKFFREIESDASANAKGVIEQNKVTKNRIFQFLLIIFFPPRFTKTNMLVVFFYRLIIIKINVIMMTEKRKLCD